jgi:hypothetical protein
MQPPSKRGGFFLLPAIGAVEFGRCLVPPKLRGDHADSSLVVFSETFWGCTYSLESFAVFINVCFKIVLGYELLFNVCLANEDDNIATTSIPIQMDRGSWIRAQEPHLTTV